MRLLRYLKRHRPSVDEVRAEAQLDLRDGLLEARAERIAELLRLNAQLTAELATYKTQEYMRQALRLRRAQAETPAAEPPHHVHPGRHRRAEPTEIHPRRPR